MSVAESVPEFDVPQFDVIVAGAGPSGGQCARQLAQAGWSVLLLEQHPSVKTNDFSSGGTPMETLERFDLPEQVFGSWWSQIRVKSTGTDYTWSSPERLGGVLDFAGLRQFLMDEVVSHGSQVRCNCRAESVTQDETGITVTVRDRATQTQQTIRAQVVVDATGPARKLMYGESEPQPELMEAIAFEYLLEVTPEVYDDFSDTLAFYIGHEWMPQGYGWVFPMAPHQLKVGVAWYVGDHAVLPPLKAPKQYLNKLIAKELGDAPYTILDIHGGALRYSETLKDKYHEGRLVAIGDAVSTVNALGGEGIRHGMDSGNIAAHHISQALKQQHFDFRGYERALRKRFGWLWRLLTYVSNKKYLQDPDWKIERTLRQCHRFKTEEIMDVLFHARVDRVMRRIAVYFATRWLGRFRRST